jgi:mono/diheme cytochrome c family protein
MFPSRRFIPGLIFALLAMLAVGKPPRAIPADEPVPHARVAPLFEKHCYGCHGAEKAKGKLRIDKLNPDFIKGNDGDHWRDVLDRLNFGDMPPAAEPALKKEDRELMTAWLDQERRRAALAKNQITHFRRLTRREYERTLQDLLGLPIEFGNRLPEDGRSKDGFRNDGDALRMSPLQYETYLQIADEALAEAIVSGPAPVVHRYRLSVGEKFADFAVTPLPRPEGRPGESFEYKSEKKDKGKPTFRIWNMSAPNKDQDKDKNKIWDGTLTPSAIRRFGEAAVQMPERVYAFGFHQAFRKGETRIKVSAARVEPAEGEEASRSPSLTVAFGSTNFHGVELKIIGEPIVIDHTEYRTYEYRVRMENVSVPNTGPMNDRNSAVVAAWNSAKAIKDEKLPPRLKIEWIEFESPYFETWPPQSHTKILFPQGEKPEPEYAREVIRRFATRAYRGPVAVAELDRLMNYWTKARESNESLEGSLRDTLGVVLTSPRFLGLPASRTGGAKERLNDHELAARLSYFLWSTMPDETLVRLANERKLRDPAVLSAQVRRMIQDPRAWAFIEQYAEQWLDLDRLQRVTVHKSSYPGFDEQLAAAMRLETIHFFGEVLRSDLSIFQFLNSDFTCVNDILAAHYGIAGVTGSQFRKVKLDDAHHRGGLLTHASVLTGNSDGKDGHPIKRGVWLLKNLFDETPPPPPPNVPELNREAPTVKNLTIPQALAVHRNNTACMGCHRKIDPWGIAFEEYDAVGNWQRDGAGATLRKRRTTHSLDAKAELPTGVKIEGMRELQAELLRTKSDQFRRAMLRKMMAYALGRSLTLTDIETADALAPNLRNRDDRLPALIELIVASERFHSK